MGAVVMSSFDSVYSPDIIQNYAKHFTPELPELVEGAKGAKDLRVKETTKRRSKR